MVTSPNRKKEEKCKILSKFRYNRRNSCSPLKKDFPKENLQKILLHYLLGMSQPSAVQSGPSPAPIGFKTSSSFSSSATLWRACKKISSGWAPEIAYFRFNTKKGTPLTPIRAASRSSSRTASLNFVSSC